MMLLIMPSPQALGYLFHLRPKYLYQYPILKDPQHLFLNQCETKVSHPYKTGKVIVQIILIYIFG
jgi:hypothetical protein